MASVMSNPKFKSDASKLRELNRLGFPMDRNTAIVTAMKVRKKIGLSPAADRKTARKALDRALGKPAV